MRWNAACPAVVVEQLDTEARAEWETFPMSHVKQASKRKSRTKV